ncbi:hypothetical protein R1sor_022877 [Riccia sorocarpa]|uniref:Reverse transcriptase domain-containing protein n=1 Tax=Riccia sorocarpa TaxID=122646 RepID=A0ABD3GMV6_9MARC
MKLDFRKAYDTIAHGFLWDTLAAMGMGEDSRSTPRLPLAPLLFAMTTQPLMRALREEERIENLQGLNIGGEQSMLHQLFADDTSICITAEERQFEKLKEVIKEFENASGACLNLQKLMVMQLKPQQQPEWMASTGCEIAGPGRCFKYLGVATSSHIDENAITYEIVKKLLQKLKHWSNCLLSWQAKTILLKHVLAAIPLYQLMSVGLCNDGLEELERLCRNFLWGWNEEGNPKHALISRGSYQREARQWTLQEGLTLLPLTRIERSPTLTRILGSWYKVRKRLRWNREIGELDGNMSMLQVKNLQQIANGGGVKGLVAGKELEILRRMGITSLEEAMEISNRVGWMHHLRNSRVFPEEVDMVGLETLDVWCKGQKVVGKNIINLE